MITIDDLINKVKELADMYPTTIYNPVMKSGVLGCTGKEIQMCDYNYGECSNGSKGCIFGQALRALGVPTNDLEGPIEEVLAYDRVAELIDRGSSYDNYSEKLEWCSHVQRLQDQRFTWKDAVYGGDLEGDDVAL